MHTSCSSGLGISNVDRNFCAGLTSHKWRNCMFTIERENEDYAKTKKKKSINQDEEHAREKSVAKPHISYIKMNFRPKKELRVPVQKRSFALSSAWMLSRRYITRSEYDFSFDKCLLYQCAHKKNWGKEHQTTRFQHEARRTKKKDLILYLKKLYYFIGN